MAKEIIVSIDSNRDSPKYLIWSMDEAECAAVKAAIGDDEDAYPLLSTLSDYYEDFECVGERLLAFSQETIDLGLKIEEHHQASSLMLKLLTMLGGIGVLARDSKYNLYGYAI
jgi:hypothetical protein